MKYASHLLRYGIPTLVLAGYVVAVVGGDSASELQDVGTALVRISGNTILIVLAFSILNYVLRFWRWQSYIARTGVPVPVVDHLLIYTAGFVFTLTPGKVGEAYRTAFLSNYGIKASDSLGVFFVERLLDLIAILILTLGVLTLWSQGLTILVGATVFIVGGTWTVLHPAVLPRLLARLKSYPPVKRSEFIYSLVTGVEAFLVSSRRYIFDRLPLMLSVSIIAWGVEGLGLWILAIEFQPELGLISAVGIYAAAVLVGALTFLPGGLGGTEVALGTLLVSGGLTISAAVAVMLVCRLATLWFAIALGLIAWMLLLFRRFNKEHS